MNLTFEQLPSRVQSKRPTKPYDRWVLENGEEASLFFRESDEYIVRFPDFADFRISLERQAVCCWPAPGISDRDIADKYFNQIVPLVMGCNGELVLHASAVTIGETAIAFLGPSRRGKSTLAAAFAQAGHPFLTDDGLILDHDGANYMVRSRAPILRLCSDSEAAILQRPGPAPDEAGAIKGPVQAGGEFAHREQPAPIGSLYLLTEPQGVDVPQIAPLSQPEALSELLRHSFILDVEDRDRVRSLFDRLVDVVASVECFGLDYPRRFPELPSVLSVIMTHANRKVE